MTEAQRTILQRPVDPARDHVRGGTAKSDIVQVVVYGDYLCPYCRRLRIIIARLRGALGERLAYVYRHFPNEKAHPGAHFISRVAEAAARQGKFWEMHDALYDADPLTPKLAKELAAGLGLDMTQFERDLEDESLIARVEEDLTEAKKNGVTGTPSFFIDGQRYDGAWDFHSMLEELQRPIAAQLTRSAKTFASLPASGGLILLLAAAAAIGFANSPLSGAYHAFMGTPFGVGVSGGTLAMPVGEWFSEGLLAIFFLLVGLEIRRELTEGSLTDLRAAALPVLCAVGGVLAPAAIYLALNRGPTAPGWSVPTATDIAFSLGVLALLGSRVPIGLRIFVAALAVVDDILSVLTLAIFYPRAFALDWLAASVLGIVALAALNRFRVYAIWPYLVTAVFLWVALHGAGVHGALAGIFLAGFLPTRPAPAAGPLLAQAATALAALEQAERETDDKRALAQEPIWDWASRNLSAASDRLLSPAERVERAVSPWSAYFILPLFAFSATGVSLAVDLSPPGASHVLAGVVLGLVFGKPIGICLAALLAVLLGLARMPGDVSLRGFIGAACLCGIGDTVALLMADQAFPAGPDSQIAKIGVLIGSVLAAALGAAVIAIKPLPPPKTVAV